MKARIKPAMLSFVLTVMLVLPGCDKPSPKVDPETETAETSPELPTDANPIEGEAEATGNKPNEKCAEDMFGAGGYSSFTMPSCELNDNTCSTGKKVCKTCQYKLFCDPSTLKWKIEGEPVKTGQCGCKPENQTEPDNN